ncbi:MetS family NSS transporter small subunit [Vallitalea pronyensis]|uniref:MetS family NSS transporter small subunit n=1 Tax=Vallitalea pronyensis TaxID=1348613 RepID=A0A8J8MKE4_9FIRM|nr:MetS family NSS transporter small subunit [Vallitalea pronyensis]QUI23265.1 MetS family NSS transporter small subunit [Vallitalea pronyensis]
MSFESAVFCALSLMILWGGFGICLRIAMKKQKQDN